MSRSLAKWLWYFLNNHFDMLKFRTKRAIEINDPLGVPERMEFNGKLKLGITKECWHMHKYYVDACIALEVDYEVIDLFQTSWLETIRKSGIDLLLARPSVVTGKWKQVVDDKLSIIEQDVGIKVFPDLRSLWFWESKHKLHYWMDANNIPCLKTWVFHTEAEAIEFSSSCSYPIVYKAEQGSGGRGVEILTNKHKLRRHIKSYFKNGYRALGSSKYDREWGAMLLQEYINNPIEWRIMRVGNSFFGYKKLAVSGMHSGSGKWEYGMPPKNLLDLTLLITNEYELYSVALDFFLADEGAPPLVNEVQAYFGMEYKDQMCVVDGVAGRIVDEEGIWVFEEGDFCQNKLCMERVKFVISQYGVEDTVCHDA